MIEAAENANMAWCSGCVKLWCLELSFDCFTKSKLRRCSRRGMVKRKMET
jgi:hypothetical protein